MKERLQLIISRSRLSILASLLIVMLTSTTALAIDLTLEQALEIAFAKSPSMRQAKLSLESSEHNLEAQQSSLKSQFNLTLRPYNFSSTKVFESFLSEYDVQEQTRSSATLSVTQPIKWTDASLSIINDVDWRKTSSSFSGSTERKSYSNNLYFSFSQPLFTYNRTKLRLKELELALERAQLSHGLQKLQIESQVTQQFLNLYHSQRGLAIAEEEFANATESYEIITSKVSAGIAAQEELFQAELTQANARAASQNSRINHENALDNFKILLGLPLEEELNVAADVHKLTVEVSQPKAIEEGLANRLELRQRDIDIENALHDLVRTGAENEFEASVELTYGLIGTAEKFGDLYSSPTRNRSVGVTLNIPLFDWGQKKHRMAATTAQLNSTRISADEERRGIVREIRQAYRNLTNQQLQVEIAEQNIKNARLTYEINLERYRNGDLSSKDIYFYQNQLSREQLNEVAALIAYRVALLDMKILTLWDFEKNEQVLWNNQES